MAKRFKNRANNNTNYKELLRALSVNKNANNKRSGVVLNTNNTLVGMLVNFEVNNITNADIDMILNDLSVTQCDVSRKSVTEKKEIQFICENEEIIAEFKKIFNPDIVSQILETYLYGINVFEVNYKQVGNLFYPRLEQRDFRNFKFKNSNENKKVLVYSGNGTDEYIDDFKIIYALNRANFRKVYGDALIKKLYFPVKIKNASVEFWYRFLEKFGSPWAIAKTEIDAEGLAAEVQAMLSGDSAVIDKEEEINLVHPSSTADFSMLPKYMDNQISKAILGANLTSDVKEGSLAAAKTHNEIREDLAANDAKILVFVINKTIEYFKKVNNLEIEFYAKLYDEDAPNLERANRDKIIFDMGFNPTTDYIKTTYNIDLEDEKREINDVFNDKNAGKKIANKSSSVNKTIFPKYGDSVDLFLNEDKLLESALKGSDKRLIEGMKYCLSTSKTYEEAFDKFALKFNDYDLDEIEDISFKTMTAAGMLGYVNE